MDPQLSLLMANLTQVNPSSLVFDPFVGTGSILIACAKFGAQVMGSDIDFLMVHARTKPSRVGQKKRFKSESFRGNFNQYQLDSKLLDVIVTDASSNPWTDKLKFDAIGNNLLFHYMTLLFTRWRCTHCSKSSFFVQKFNFDFSRKLLIFWGEKLAKMLWFLTYKLLTTLISRENCQKKIG